MKMTTNRKKLVLGLVFGAVGAIALSISPGTRAPDLVRRANAAGEPRVIEIQAKKFQFTPSEVTLKKGEPAILRLTSADRAHGFLLKPFQDRYRHHPGQGHGHHSHTHGQRPVFGDL
jgi:cytochrome c oxidase subunit II